MGKLGAWFAGARRNWALFLAAGVFFGVATGVTDTSFNNYLSGVFGMTARTRGFLEFPRELPGCGIVAVTALLAFLPEVKLAVLAAFLWGLGVIGVGLLAPDLAWLVVWMMVWNMGTHLYMPLSQAIGVGVAEPDRVGQRLGQLAGANTAALILGAGVVWLGQGHLGLGFKSLFITAAVAAVLASLCLGLMRTARREAGARRTRFVFRKEYMLFYAMSVLYGARKQVFLTFGPWVIIKVFNQPASTIALLWIVASVLGIAAKPLLGMVIDKAGERLVLMAESGLLILVCLGYAMGKGLMVGGFNLGLYLTCACFVADQLLMAVGIARTTYLNKIAREPGDLTPTLSLGISLDHVVSMTIPALGGLVWTACGYGYVFAAAAVLALVNLLAASRVAVPRAVSGPAAPCSAGR